MSRFRFLSVCGFVTVVLALLAGGAFAGEAGGSVAVRGEAGQQFIPMYSYREGPYAQSGLPIFAGFMDYLAMLNKRDGGINGVKLVWEECETQYKPALALECYDRFMRKHGATGIIAPFSTGITYALIEKATADKIPLMTMGYGRADASDGRVFPYVFPIVTNYWSLNTAMIRFLGVKSGGMDKLRGAKIVNLHHGSAYGRETKELLDLQAKKYGFQVTHIEVPHPGEDQTAQWRQIKEIKPEYVILRGWGVMNQVALKTAHEVGYPAYRIVGVWWSGAEEDTIPAGRAASGYIAAGFHLSGDQFPVIRDIKKYVYGTGGQGAIDDPQRIGQTFYNRGVIQGILVAESIRTAQGRFGHRPLTGEQLRWGIENLRISDRRVAQLGAFGMMQSVKLSCSDHEGGGSVRFQKWLARRWFPMTSWIESDSDLVRPLIEASAAKYAKEKGITPRDCSKEEAAVRQASR